MGQTLAVGQPAPGQFHLLFHGGVYLVLHAPVAGPADSHGNPFSFLRALDSQEMLSPRGERVKARLLTGTLDRNA